MDNYEKPEWAIQQLMRLSGLVEDVCKHGCGHPNKEWLEKHGQVRSFGWSIHGCDGCCGLKIK